MSWQEFLDRLSANDRTNVLQVIARVEQLSQSSGIPLGVMAVGSVLYKPLGEYNDIDLLLLPLNTCDVTSSEEVFTDFIRSQPEVRKKKPIKWRSHHCYDINLYWNLRFPKGRCIQIFICTDWRRRTLKEQLETEIKDKRYLDQPYAYCVIDN